MNQVNQDPPEQPEAAQNGHFGFTLFSRRYFLRLAMGEERRSDQRLDAEGQKQVPVLPVASGLAGTLIFSLFGVLCFLYLLKALTGVDLFEGTSVLHPLYELFHK